MKILIIVFICIFFQQSLAKDFGIYGTVFPIIEEGFVAMIKNRLQKIDLLEEQKKMVEITEKYVHEPLAVRGISRSLEDKIFFFDPTYILKEEVNAGGVFYAAGTKVNPLDYMDFNERLIFIDGRDEEQIKWLGKIEESTLETKIILVGGKIFELQNRLKTPLYFDQAGELTSRFNIKHVPAIALQEGKKLKILEIKLRNNEEL